MNVNFINKKVSPNFKIFFVNKDKKNITDYSISSDKEIQNNILNLLSKRNFNGLLNQISNIEIFDKKINHNFLFIGIGETSEIKEFNFQYFGGLLFSFIENLKYKKISVSIENVKKISVSKESIILNLAAGIKLKSYSFTKYKNIKKDKKFKIEEINFVTSQSAKYKKMFISHNAVTEGVFFSRDLLHEPPNVLNPVHLASRAKELTKFGLKVNILDEKKMKKLGMNALLGVGMGSANPSRLITLEWNGNPRSKKAYLGLVGKGVTFDTGGYSLKPSSGME